GKGSAALFRGTRFQGNGAAVDRHRPVTPDGNAAIALEANLNGRAFVVGVGNQDSLLAGLIDHDKLVAARRLQALE
nr:hypothetical protein [Tanacetum cinerariifolium]